MAKNAAITSAIGIFYGEHGDHSYQILYISSVLKYSILSSNHVFQF
jgi:hypothetical protein